MYEPRLPLDLQSTLESLELAADIVRNTNTDVESHRRGMQEIEAQRDEVFARADTLGIGAWQRQ